MKVSQARRNRTADTEILKNGLRIFCVTVLILGISTTSSFAYTLKLRGSWNEYKSTHFIIYSHPSISNKYVREFTRTCERYYNLITERLGFNRFDFWLWEDRAKIFIYKSREEYLKETQRSEWSAASVHIRKNFINTFYFEEDFFDTILPHELTHIILREFIGLKTKAPLWFDEGVACANEEGSYLIYLLVTKGFAEKGICMSVSQMERITGAKELVVPSVFYPTAASLVIFLLENYKKRYFVEFCRELREGNTFYGAMNKVYGIEDAKNLNGKFLTFMRNKSYRDIVNSDSFSVEW